MIANQYKIFAIIANAQKENILDIVEGERNRIVNLCFAAAREGKYSISADISNRYVLDLLLADGFKVWHSKFPEAEGTIWGDTVGW